MKKVIFLKKKPPLVGRFVIGSQTFDLILLALVADRSEVVFITPFGNTDEAFPIAFGSVFSAAFLTDQFVFFRCCTHDRKKITRIAGDVNPSKHIFLKKIPHRQGGGDCHEMGSF